MAARLVGFVHVRDADHGPHVFGPDDDVPQWARVKIRNPYAWEQVDPPLVGPSGDDGTVPEPSSADRARGVVTDAELNQRTQAIEPGDESRPPPKGGRGSGAGAWRAYARARGVQVADDAERDDVVELLEARGIRTEREDADA